MKKSLTEFIDISLPLEEGMIVWPGDTKFKREEHRGTAIVSKITMSSHAGTHLDAPRHFVFKKGGVDTIALKKLIGPAKVVHVAAQKTITREDLKKFPIRAGDRLLFKTRNSKLLRQKKFTADYVSLSLEGAKYLADKKIVLVGIDYYGIEAKGVAGHPVHKTLLTKGIVIVEGLDLSKVKAGTYQMATLPLRLIGADGSPARAVLWR